MPGKVNISSVLSKVKASKKLETEINKKVVNSFKKNKNQLIVDFENHPVSKEIKNGPNASNTSGTLGGKGNLFSFIGFNNGDKPIENFLSVIKSKIDITKGSVASKGKKIIFNYKIKYPNTDELSSVTPMPWEGGNSWLLGIERGISGFSNYIYKNFISKSRSKTGIQTKNEISGGVFKPIKYFSEILNKFLNGVKNIK